MKFHDFLESSHVTNNINLQTNYHPSTQAKILAGSDLIAFQRWILKVLHYFTLMFTYMLIELRLKKAPGSAQEIIKSYQDQAALALEAAQQQAAAELAQNPQPLQVVPQPEQPVEVQEVPNQKQSPLGEVPYNPATMRREDAIKQMLEQQKAEADKKDQ